MVLMAPNCLNVIVSILRSIHAAAGASLVSSTWIQRMNLDAHLASAMGILLFVSQLLDTQRVILRVAYDLEKLAHKWRNQCFL